VPARPNAGPTIQFVGNDHGAVSHRKKEVLMSRSAGMRYECEECGAVLVYEKPCPCTSDTTHSEICCNKQMKQLVHAK
jgi:hypothetical protein